MDKAYRQSDEWVCMVCKARWSVTDEARPCLCDLTAPKVAVTNETIQIDPKPRAQREASWRAMQARFDMAAAMDETGYAIYDPATGRHSVANVMPLEASPEMLKAGGDVFDAEPLHVDNREAARRIWDAMVAAYMKG